MSKECQWSHIHGEGTIVCTCDQCGHTHEHDFDGGSPDYRGAQEAIKADGWISRKIEGQWHDYCSERCYYNWIKENM